MKQVGVPLMAIKQKLLMEGLDYKTFIDYTTNTKKILNINVNKTPLHKKCNPIKRKMLNFKDLLSQKK